MVLGMAGNSNLPDTLRPVRDVVLIRDMRHAATGASGVYELTPTHFIRVTDDVELGPAYAPDDKLPDAIRRACSAPGENFNPVLHETYIYVLVRHRAPTQNQSLFNWDSDQRLQVCIALSRLIRPTSMDFHLSARIIGTGDTRQIVPGAVYGFGCRAWTSTPGRDWLDQADVDAWGTLADQYFKSTPPDRLRRAMWYHEYAARSFLLEVRTPMCVTGLEALVNTDPFHAGRQFRKRIARLAIAVGASPVSQQRARDMYELRSKLVHGESIAGTPYPDHLNIYMHMEEILRLTLRQSIQDASFASQFTAKATVDAAFP